MTVTLTDKEVWLMICLLSQEKLNMQMSGNDAYAESTQALIDKLSATGIPNLFTGA